MTDSSVETVARAISIPEHHTTWDLLTETQKDLYRMQADYAIKAIAALPSPEREPLATKIDELAQVVEKQRRLIAKLESVVREHGNG